MYFPFGKLRRSPGPFGNDWKSAMLAVVAVAVMTTGKGSESTVTDSKPRCLLQRRRYEGKIKRAGGDAGATKTDAVLRIRSGVYDRSDEKNPTDSHSWAWRGRVEFVLVGWLRA